ncbi:MAG: M23 family metallopeptidase [Ruminococcus sp.]|nr:M23 family metallopeptidase [Ruminococcus sp.]
MNAPYMGRFHVSQQYSEKHTGLDLVGVDSKEIHSTVPGTVIRAGWENPNDHSKGFGLRVVIQKDGTNEFYYYGHMSEIRVKVGDKVKVTDVIGIEGSTGYSTGSHCHYECRLDDTKSKHQNISEISGIPNAIGTYDDGYRQPTVVKTLHAKIVLAGETWEGDLEEVKT